MYFTRSCHPLDGRARAVHRQRQDLPPTHRATERIPDGDDKTDADDAVRAAFGGAMGGWQILPLPVDRTGATVQRVT